MEPGSVFLLLYAVYASLASAATGHVAGNVAGEDRIALAVKTLAEILDDLEYLDEEEEKNDIDTDVDDTTWVDPCQLLEQLEMTKGQVNFEELVRLNLNKWNYCVKKWMSHVSYASWNYVTDLTEENKQKYTTANVEYSKWHRQLSRNAQQLYDDQRTDDLESDIRRQIRLFAQNASPKKDGDVRDLNDLVDDLEEIYSTAKLGKLSLEPDLQSIIAHSRDPPRLLLVWKGWRDVTGPKMREKYTAFVRLLNIGARDNGYSDYSEAWLEDQFDGTYDIEETAEELWQDVKPLYEELHAYVRRKLHSYYKKKVPDENIVNQFGAIPAHLLGNMWAQDWRNIYDMVKPYPEVEEPDYDKEMKEQGYTVDRLFSMAEEFYTSIGLFPMTEKFKKYSMLVRPPPEEHREVVCHASAEDFFTKDDFRIKMCTEINIEDFSTIHHEMGHIEYFMAYENQPAIYRAGANSAFHEAVGDTISLSVMSRKHLETIGLLKQDDIDSGTQRKSDINYLLKMALSKIAFLPFGYMIDKWRWGVFRGEVQEKDYNRNWWNLRLKYQGLVSPVARSEADFDPGAKFHIASNSPYICYFISFIIQFQFYEAMCKSSGHQGELYNCDFYQSKDAGDLLRNALSFGKSKPWQKVMEDMTGSADISANAIKEYFDPLYKWLKKENEEASRKGGRNVVGWSKDKINWVETTPDKDILKNL